MAIWLSWTRGFPVSCMLLLEEWLVLHGQLQLMPIVLMWLLKVAPFSLKNIGFDDRLCDHFLHKASYQFWNLCGEEVVGDTYWDPASWQNSTRFHMQASHVKLLQVFGLISSPFLKWGSKSSKRWNNSPKKTQTVPRRAGFCVLSPS